MTELSEQYQESKWNGLDRYACKLCTFDTVDGIGAMELHLLTEHFQQPAPTPPVIATATRFGKVIEPEAQVAEIEFDISDLSVDAVLELVESGKLRAELVITSERAGKGRKSLLKALGAKE